MFAVLVSLAHVSICSAMPITFIPQGSGSGTLNGIASSNRSFVITAHGNTADRASPFAKESSLYAENSTSQLKFGKSEVGERSRVVAFCSIQHVSY